MSMKSQGLQKWNLNEYTGFKEVEIAVNHTDSSAAPFGNPSEIARFTDVYNDL